MTDHSSFLLFDALLAESIILGTSLHTAAAPKRSEAIPTKAPKSGLTAAAPFAASVIAEVIDLVSIPSPPIIEHIFVKLYFKIFDTV